MIQKFGGFILFNPPIISNVGGLELIGLLFPYVYTVMYELKGICGCQEELIGKFAIVCSVRN